MFRNNPLSFARSERPETIVSSCIGSGRIPFSVVRPTSITVAGSDIGTAESRNKKCDKIVGKLKKKAEKILNGEPVGLSFAAVHRNLQLVILYRPSEQAKFADWLLGRIDNYLVSMSFARRLNSMQGVDVVCDPKMALAFAEHFTDVFNTWCEKLNTLLRVFAVLDGSYLLQHPKKLTIRQHGLNMFAKTAMLASSEPDLITGHLSGELSPYAILVYDAMQAIHLDSRCALSNAHDKLLIKLISLLELLEKETSIQFGKCLYRSIIDNYKGLQERWKEDEQLYVAKLLTSLCYDAVIFEECDLDSAVVGLVMNAVKWQLLFSDFSASLEPSMKTLLEEDEGIKLRVLEQLCISASTIHNSNLLDQLIYVWGKYVLEETKRTIQKSRLSDVSLVDLFAKLWRNLEDARQRCIEWEKFGSQLTKNLSDAISDPSLIRYVLGLLSKYCDSFLKQTDLSAEQYEDYSNKALRFFQFISSKHEFLSIYERDVSKRFLLGRNFNFRAEEKFVEDITHCLKQYGTEDDSINLRTMFSDIESSMSEHKMLRMLSEPNIDFNAVVLQKRFWPDLPKQGNDLILPEPFRSILEEFSASYNKQSARSKLHILDWTNYTFHQITMNVAFDKGSKELTMNLVQAIVLQLFSSDEVLNYDQLMQQTNLDEKLLKRVVASLSSDRYPILKVSGDLVTFNGAFWDKSSRIRLGMGRERETK